MVDFNSADVKIYPKNTLHGTLEHLQPIWEETQRNIPHIGTIVVIGDVATEPTEECAISDFGAPEQYELPVSTTNSFLPVIDLYFIPHQELQ